jgi:hypothetical protein
MSFQNPNQPRKQKPILEHSFLTKKGPKLVTIKSVPQVIISKKDQKKYHLLTIELAGIDYIYFIPNRDIEDKLKQHVGKTVVITATGNTKRGTATMEIQAAMVKASTLDKPVVAHKPTAEPIKNPEPKDREAKAFLCQAANLMRLCVKKANDIAVELDLPNEHRQGIATTLFIQADRQGHIFKMPINAYSPEDLGWGASKADSLTTPQPEELND